MLWNKLQLTLTKVSWHCGDVGEMTERLMYLLKTKQTNKHKPAKQPYTFEFPSCLQLVMADVLLPAFMSGVCVALAVFKLVVIEFCNWKGVKSRISKVRQRAGGWGEEACLAEISANCSIANLPYELSLIEVLMLGK